MNVRRNAKNNYECVFREIRSTILFYARYNSDPNHGLNFLNTPMMHTHCSLPERAQGLWTLFSQLNFLNTPVMHTHCSLPERMQGLWTLFSQLRAIRTPVSCEQSGTSWLSPYMSKLTLSRVWLWSSGGMRAGEWIRAWKKFRIWRHEVHPRIQLKLRLRSYNTHRIFI